MYLFVSPFMGICRITVGAVLSVPFVEVSEGPPKNALESNPLPDGSGGGASF